MPTKLRSDPKVERLAAASPHVASIEVPAESAEDIATCLEAAEAPAALAVAWFGRASGEVEVSGYYAAEPSRELLLDLLASAASPEVLEALRIEPLPDRNWVAEAEALRGPVRIGRFLVHGAHDLHRLARRRCNIEIDAGLAFGTAHHASTKGCLVALDRLLKVGRPKTVLDIGTGSGILAIAAAKAVKATVLACDNDPVAVGIAAENARKNGVAAYIQVAKSDGLSHPLLRRARADLLFANLVLRPLLALAPDFARALPAGGVCVLSGILSSQAAQVEARYRAMGFVLKDRILLEGWTTLMMFRRSPETVRD
jgi:ribosomal protein L11 methyltransferase